MCVCVCVCYMCKILIYIYMYTWKGALIVLWNGDGREGWMHMHTHKYIYIYKWYIYASRQSSKANIPRDGGGDYRSPQLYVYKARGSGAGICRGCVRGLYIIIRRQRRRRSIHARAAWSVPAAVCSRTPFSASIITLIYTHVYTQNTT